MMVSYTDYSVTVTELKVRPASDWSMSRIKDADWSMNQIKYSDWSTNLKVVFNMNGSVDFKADCSLAAGHRVFVSCSRPVL